MGAPFAPDRSVIDAARRLADSAAMIQRQRRLADAEVTLMEARWAANRTRHPLREDDRAPPPTL